MEKREQKARMITKFFWLGGGARKPHIHKAGGQWCYSALDPSFRASVFCNKLNSKEGKE